MANEINIPQDAGLTLTVKVYSVTGAQQGSTVNLTEVATGLYSGDFSPVGIADGRYTVLFFNGPLVVGFGNIYVVDELEVDLHTLESKLQADARQVALIAEVDANEAKIDTIETKAQADARQALLIAEMNANEAKIDLIETKVQADARQAIILANISPLETKAQADIRQGALITQHSSSQASLSAILADTNELQTNQGNWETATGFATAANITDAQTAIQDDIAALNNFDPATDTVAHVTLVDLTTTTTTNTDMRGTNGAVTSLTGIATSLNVSAARDAVQASILASETVVTDEIGALPSAQTVADAVLNKVY